MSEDRFRAMLGMALFLLMMGIFFGLTYASRDSVNARLYPAPDLSTIGESGRLKFLNGYANW
jgi:hypothetical protein